ncbi:GtrA family protein [Halovivax limisalsi]|uniref:GtrA family protein n=1 Tax=Halovivax limisalsi TaxID=1453760 RepID=UPI001FFC42F7|nr:GtrA family protein [Halovivax limisalsi]
MIRRLLRSVVVGPYATQLRRFFVVGLLAAIVQLALLWAFVDRVGVHYILGALIAIELTIVLSYVLNNAWTFRAAQNSGSVDYLVGLVKTNVVRGTAIPIQLGLLFAFVEWVTIPYLIANGVAIVLSGVYRFVLDATWTWG